MASAPGASRQRVRQRPVIALYRLQSYIVGGSGLKRGSYKISRIRLHTNRHSILTGRYLDNREVEEEHHA